MMKKRKVEAMVAKQRRAKKEISLTNEKDNKSDTRDNTDSNQANNKYP